MQHKDVQRYGRRVPVEFNLNLQQQKATVERTPVDRPATEADFENFKEGTFEVRETAEEAVIGKTARVVGEVAVGRMVTNRTEKVYDTVRRTDVEVERVQPRGATKATSRNHHGKFWS